MINIDLQSRVPIYEQIYKKISELIIKGVLHEGDQIPSVRSLAKQLGINPNTVAKAYLELERTNITYSLSGRGSFVGKIDQEHIKSYILFDFDHCVREALTSGLTKNELIDYIKEVEL
jgi:GntR family transcriptional regulator